MTLNDRGLYDADCRCCKKLRPITQTPKPLAHHKAIVFAWTKTGQGGRISSALTGWQQSLFVRATAAYGAKYPLTSINRSIVSKTKIVNFPSLLNPTVNAFGIF